MIAAVGSGVKKLISAVESAGELKRINEGDSDNCIHGGVADSKYNYDGKGKSGEVQKMDHDVDVPSTGEEDDHGMVTVMGRSRGLTTAASVAVGEIPLYDLFGIFFGPGVGKSSGESFLGLVTKELGESGEVVDWGKVARASFSDVARAVVIIGKDEVVVLHGGSPKVVLYRGGATVPLSIHDDESEGKETITIHNRTEMDEFIVIACSAVWDVVPEIDTYQLVKSCLEGDVRKKHLNGKSLAAEAAVMVLELAIARGIKDNISVIVIDLNKSKT